MDARILKSMTNPELSNVLSKVYEDYELFRWGDVAMVINEVASRLAAPWTIIDPADPGTLPKNTNMLISFWDGEASQIYEGQWENDGLFYPAHGPRFGYAMKHVKIYAYMLWQPWPEPAPLPGVTADKTK